MVAERTLEGAPTRLAVVLDVVTRGATLLAAVSRVKDVFPEADVSGFGLVRTMSTGDVPAIVEPSVGVLTLDGAECFRRP